MEKHAKRAAALIALGGFPGSGKSTVARQLSEDFGIPRLGSDFFGRTIQESKELLKDETKAFWLGFDALFKCAREQLSLGVSVIVDTSFGLDFQWRKLDSIIEATPGIALLPIILRAERSRCEKRIESRHAANPGRYDPISVFKHERFEALWSYLEALERPDIHYIDGNPGVDEVYESVLRVLEMELALPKPSELYRESCR